MSMQTDMYLPYSDSVEVRRPDEEKTFEELSSIMHGLSVLMNDRYRHAVRSVHAKSHGLLKGELEVSGDLSGPLRQGLFAKAGKYPVIIRLSTTPGDILADSVSTPRGMAVKVLGVEGEMLPDHRGQSTQDFVLINGKFFPSPDAEDFIKIQKLIVANANDPELFKKLVSNAARGLNAVLALVGKPSIALANLGHPETHILGETFASAAALRYGDFIAKVQIAPASDNLKALTGKGANVNFHYSGLRDAVVEFFKTETAVWDFGVQLCTDLQTMPVEDPSKEWPEDKSPYLTVAKLTVQPQDAYSPARRVFVDEVLAFDPWHALAAHRPLGNVMRARKVAYPPSARFRREMNGRAAREPQSIEELPD